MSVMKGKYKGVLETEHLVLRHFVRADADAMLMNWASDPDVIRFLPTDVCYTLEETHGRLDRWFDYFKEVEPGTWEMFAIVLGSTGELIGEIDYAETDTENRSAEVGYQLGKAWWGLGYAAEALQVMMKHCFETVGLKRIWGDYDARNINSGKVMVKAGMHYERTTHSKNQNGETVSKIQYSIMADDYYKRK